MALVEAVMAMARTTGIPADDVHNTFHFSTASSDPAVYGPLISALLTEFYDDPVASPGGTIERITELLSDELTRDWTLTIRDADPAPPRPVLYTESGVFAGAAFVDTSYPAEVAIASSYRATPAADPAFPGRYRGRVFIGPLVTAAGSDDLQEITRPTSNAREVLAQAADRLMAGGAPATVEWGVYSRTNVPHTLSVITDGWVDNAFDTIRSRGPRSTARRVWPA